MSLAPDLQVRPSLWKVNYKQQTLTTDRSVKSLHLLFLLTYLLLIPALIKHEVCNAHVETQ